MPRKLSDRVLPINNELAISHMEEDDNEDHSKDDLTTLLDEQEHWESRIFFDLTCAKEWSFCVIFAQVIEVIFALFALCMRNYSLARAVETVL